MKNPIYPYSAILAALLLSSCGKEELSNKQTDAALNFRSGSSSISVTTDWAEGATSVLNASAHAAQTAKTVTIWNDLGNVNRGRIGFQRWDQTGAGHFGRTNNNTTGGKDGDALHAFAFATTNWTAKVPFAFGTNANGTREAIWTPSFVNVGIATNNSALFVTDNGTGDEDATTGIIEVGDFRAIDGDFHESRPNKVIFRKWNGSSWAQIGRTNGAGDDGDLLALAVINARTAYTVSGGKVTAQNMEAIPVVKLKRSSTVTRLITDLPGQSIGTAMMYQY